MPARSAKTLKLLPESGEVSVYRCLLVKDSTFAPPRAQLSRPRAAAEIVQMLLDGVDREHFLVLMLDSKLKFIGVNTVSVGGLDAAIVDPRQVFKPALLANAASIILAHNHPSGDPKPSAEDIDTTLRLAEAGKLLNLQVNDHIITGENCYVSMKQEGYFSLTQRAGLP